MIRQACSCSALSKHNPKMKTLMFSLIFRLLIFGTQVYGLEKKCSVPRGCTDGTAIKEWEVPSDKLFDCNVPGLCQVHKYVGFKVSLILYKIICRVIWTTRSMMFYQNVMHKPVQVI